MPVIAVFTLTVALAISATAIYYSVSGLAAIFAAAVVPVVIMGTTLEISKLAAALWLHRHWHEAPRYLKIYLSFAVAVLMLITSLGIFGYLSRAHIEQTAASGEQAAQLERIESDIARQERTIARAEQRIRDLRGAADGDRDAVDDRVQAAREEIAAVRARTEDSIARSQARIDRADDALERRIAPHRDALEQLDRQIERLDQVIAGLIEKDYLSRAQQRQAEQQPERARIAAERAEIIQRIDAIRAEPNPRVAAAKARISDLRAAERETIADLRARIRDLQAGAGTPSAAALEERIAEQRGRIVDAREALDTLSARKFELDAKLRSLEAEVGPIKYIAAFVYGAEPDHMMLEEAVRWVIVLIITVFDPLAVLLLIASQWSLLRHRAGPGGPGGHAPATGPAATASHATASHATASHATALGAAAPSVGAARTPPPASAGRADEAPSRTRAPASPAPAHTPAPRPEAGNSPTAPRSDPNGALAVDPPDRDGPDGDEGPDGRIKRQLLERARQGKRKPSAKARSAAERELADALARYTNAADQAFDRAFVQELRTLAPKSWINDGRG